MKRCDWVTDEQIYLEYHDHEWAKPVYTDTELFEALILEGAQAGLSWITVLKKRANYRQALNDFNIDKIAQYNFSKIEQLMSNPGLIRHRGKINSIVKNAQASLKVIDEFNSLEQYFWNFVNFTPIINKWKCMDQVPSQTPLSITMSKDLKKRGFNFVGPTICYSFMQATGMVNDHLVDCEFY